MFADLSMFVAVGAFNHEMHEYTVSWWDALEHLQLEFVRPCFMPRPRPERHQFAHDFADRKREEYAAARTRLELELLRCFRRTWYSRVTPASWTRLFTQEMSKVFGVAPASISRCIKCILPWNLLSIRRLELMMDSAGLRASATKSGVMNRDLPASEMLNLVRVIEDIMNW